MNPPRPHLLQLSEEVPTYILVDESIDPTVAAVQPPLVQVSVLKDPISLKIMLAHCLGEGMDAERRHGERFAETPKGHMKGFLVPVNVLEIVIAVFVVVHCQV